MDIMSELGELDEVNVTIRKTCKKHTSDESSSSHDNLPPRVVFESKSKPRTVPPPVYLKNKSLSLKPKSFPPPLSYRNKSRSVNVTKSGSLSVIVDNESSNSSCDSDSSESSVISDASSVTSSTELNGTSSSSDDDVDDEVQAPLFVNDGIVGNLDDTEVITKIYPGKSTKSIIASLKQDITSFNRVIFMSVGNFESITLPECANNLIQRNRYRNKLTTSFRECLDSFNTYVQSKGGRLYVMEIFPSPSVLDPDRSELTSVQQRLGWKVFLDVNKTISDFNLNNGRTRTLIVTSYLRAPVKLDKRGRRKNLRKNCLEVSSDEDVRGERKTKRLESRVNKNLHREDNIHLLETPRRVVALVVLRAIKETV